MAHEHDGLAARGCAGQHVPGDEGPGGHLIAPHSGDRQVTIEEPALLLVSARSAIEPEVEAREAIPDVEQDDARDVGPPQPGRTSQQGVVHGARRRLQVEEERRHKLEVAAGFADWPGPNAAQPMGQKDEPDEPAVARDHAEPVAKFCEGFKMSGLLSHQSLQGSKVEQQSGARDNEDPTDEDLLHSMRHIGSLLAVAGPATGLLIGGGAVRVFRVRHGYKVKAGLRDRETK
mmetsp:Transcript_82212/g.172105  ORF Transcript_82212/g.172105 Transcript_82212/m.172105 type:complete len:232 (-) Transcript_82212:18-713(-)